MMPGSEEEGEEKREWGIVKEKRGKSNGKRGQRNLGERSK
jgi:hypothetical protein